MLLRKVHIVTSLYKPWNSKLFNYTRHACDVKVKLAPRSAFLLQGLAFEHKKASASNQVKIK